MLPGSLLAFSIAPFTTMNRVSKMHKGIQSFSDKLVGGELRIVYLWDCLYDLRGGQ